MLRNWGAALALVGLIAATTIGFSFFDRPHCYDNKNACINQYKQSAVNNNFPSFVTITAWVATNRDTIEAISAIGSLVFAAALALFTAVLAGKTSGLFVETAGLREVASKQRADMLRAIGAAENSAIAMKDLAAAAAKQAKVAGDALAKLERPYIFIYDVNVFLQDAQTKEFYLTYTVANFGRIPAIVDGAWIGFEFSDRGSPPMPTLLNEDHSLLASPILAAGEKREGLKEYLPIGMSAGDNGSIVDLRDGNPVRIVPNITIPPNNDLFFVAKISYRGPFTEGHETGALWLNHSPGQFVKRGGAEYNHNR